VRIVRGGTRGPVRELHLGSGYWSSDSPTLVVARPADATAIWVRWPGGKEETVPLQRGSREILLKAP
jgi:hypothetical protein